eukprot:RCo022962
MEIQIHYRHNPYSTDGPVRFAVIKPFPRGGDHDVAEHRTTGDGVWGNSRSPSMYSLGHSSAVSVAESEELPPAQASAHPILALPHSRPKATHTQAHNAPHGFDPAPSSPRNFAGAGQPLAAAANSMGWSRFPRKAFASGPPAIAHARPSLTPIAASPEVCRAASVGLPLPSASTAMSHGVPLKAPQSIRFPVLQHGPRLQRLSHGEPHCGGWDDSAGEPWAPTLARLPPALYFPCFHFPAWKRIRAKKGVHHYMCQFCGSRWKGSKFYLQFISRPLLDRHPPTGEVSGPEGTAEELAQGSSFGSSSAG